jgi:hypothetical protein
MAGAAEALGAVTTETASITRRDVAEAAALVKKPFMAAPIDPYP